ncbi:MAG: metallophosphoesterase [Acutalibacteraceae bacterium]
MVYITGDMHGEYKRFKDKKLKKLSEKDVLIICGDFGFLWNNTAEERKILRQIGDRKHKTLFLDGRHENFALLKEYDETELFGGKAGHICGNLYHLRRGEIYEIENESYFVFGGGCEDNLDIEEGGENNGAVPTMDEMRYGAEQLGRYNNKVDYILTHEPPFSYGVRMGRRFISEPFCFFLEEIFKNVSYRRWFFGSLHTQSAVGEKGQAVFTEIVPVHDKK